MKKLIYSLSLFSALTFCGCEDFLTTNPSNNVTEDMLLENVNGAQVLLNGIYRHIKSEQAFDLKGLAGLQYTLSSSGKDIAVTFSGNGYYQNYVYQPTRGESTNASTLKYWTYFYKVISNCNILLEHLSSLEGDQATIKSIRGQALALRGWSYFYLVRMFQQTYSIAKNMPGVPLYVNRTLPEMAQNDRASVDEIYSQIIKDLTEAVELLAGYKREDITYIDQTVALGFLSELYLTMENWQQAADCANRARSKYELMTKEEFQSGFSKENREWMWGFHQTAEDNIKGSNLFFCWATNGHREAVNAGVNNNIGLDEKFVALFDESDVRNQFFISVTTDLYTSGKFRDEAPNHLGDMINMRAAEMYLIEAEALARLGRTGEALSLLNHLQKQREVSRLTENMNQAELIDAILLERRKELYSEGFDLFDLLRLQKDLVREGESHDQSFTIPARSYRFLFQIPSAEVDLGGISVQNPKDDIYNP